MEEYKRWLAIEIEKMYLEVLNLPISSVGDVKVRAYNKALDDVLDLLEEDYEIANGD